MVILPVATVISPVVMVMFPEKQLDADGEMGQRGEISQ
jgi:hypothetical protein